MKTLLCKVIPIVLLLMMADCAPKSTETSSQSAETKAADKEAEVATEESNNNETGTGYVSEYRTWDTIAYEVLQSRLPPFDLKQDLSTKTLEELRILRNTIPARYGYLFTTSDMRYYFYGQPWYKPLMEARWYGDCEYSGLKKAPPIAYTAEETAFMEKVKKLETEKLALNYITRNGRKYANVKNIINSWQYGRMPEALIRGLDQNGFAIVPGENVQHFHVYEENDYSQTQNFVTTDLYLQLFHMHFSFLLRGLEEEQFVPILTELTSGVLAMADKLNQQTNDAQLKDASQFTYAFYSIPYRILSDKDVTVPGSYAQAASAELDKIESEKATMSVLLSAYKENEFQYDMFKPRGHYTRNETLKKYFKSMQWLQLAPYCINDDTDLKRALVAAYVLNTGKSQSGKSLKELYQAILDPTSFLIGKPDNVSLIDVCDVIEKRKITNVTDLLKNEMMVAIRTDLMNVESSKNVIKPKIQLTCPSKINFMPSRFVLDNEILQEMTELKARPYPKGLDVLAAFGSKAAEDILINTEKEDKKWSQFLPTLKEMKTKYSNYESWNETVYAKWIKGLNELLKPDPQYPSFMQLPSWNKKNLNTALASWAELKHDAILYAEQPMAAECGGGEDCSPPPEPYVVGYVEPNVRYWSEALELLTLTETMLAKHGLLTEPISYKQNRLRELCQFLLATSQKELRGEKLTEQEYNTIERIGSTVDYITLSIFGTDNWGAISGPDKEVAIVADVYTNNQGDQAGILHAAVGYVNDLYVVVEIEGYLYLVKGATFSYYEFPMPIGERLTDEQWQEMLKKRKVFPVPQWMNDVIIKLDKNIQPEAKEFLYSSGC